MTFTTPFRGNLPQPDCRGGIELESGGDNAANSARGQTKSPRLSQPQTTCSIRTPGPDRSLSQYKSTSNVGSLVQGNHCPSSTTSSSTNSSFCVNTEPDLPDLPYQALPPTFTLHSGSENKSISSHKNLAAKKNQSKSKAVSKLDSSKKGNSNKSKQGTKNVKVTPSYQLPPNIYLTATDKQSQPFQAKPMKDDQCENIDVAECAAILSGREDPVVCEASETSLGSENVRHENIVQVVVEMEQGSSLVQDEAFDIEVNNEVGGLATDEETSETDLVPIPSLDLENGSVRSETNNQLVCDICKKQFNSLKYYATHISKCEKDLLCFKCKKIFKNKRILRQHLLQIHLDVKKCDACGESFSTEKKLAKHKNKVHSTTEIRCENCNGVFKNKKSLGVHKA